MSTCRQILIGIEIASSSIKVGEIIRGVTLWYNKKRGFFVIPVVLQCNNDRIYVVADALESISLGDAAEK